MADLSTARGRYWVSGAVRKTGDFSLKVSGPSSRTTYTQTWGRLGIGGTIRQLGSLSGKTLVSLQPIPASDLLLLTLTEDPVDTQGITTADSLRFSITEAAVVFRFQAVVDSLALSISETISLIKNGVIDFPVSDTLSLSVSDASSLSISLDLTDTLALAITDASSIVISTIDVPVVDTLSLAIADLSITQIFAGINALTAFDDLRFALSEVAVRSDFVEAPPAVPVTRMLFSLQTQSVRFELV
jgi:hypothetical protein